MQDEEPKPDETTPTAGDPPGGGSGIAPTVEGDPPGGGSGIAPTVEGDPPGGGSGEVKP
jgi:hypothetical protein